MGPLGSTLLLSAFSAELSTVEVMGVEFASSSLEDEHL